MNSGGTAKIKVTGNVRSTSDYGTGIIASDSTVSVEKDEKGEGGNVTGNTGINTEKGANVTVSGNVEASETGIAVAITGSDTEKSSSIVVEGTLSETGADGHVISFQVPDDATVATVQNKQQIDVAFRVASVLF